MHRNLLLTASLPAAALLIGDMAAAGDDLAKDSATPPDAVLRRNLLASHRDQLRRIIFTKHFDMGGSHYAYTDAVSDEDALNPNGVVKEFNFTPGSSLCLLETGDDYEFKETTLIRDEDGVFRDPDVSYDGKRILFAWKKSARGDDYHLYEMDFATRAVRQLTSGQGVADYEGFTCPMAISCSVPRVVIRTSIAGT